jgi:ribonuclease HI
MIPAVVHLDESCLGNGREGDNPGGAGGLIEARSRGKIQRRDFYTHAPATTNNRMALTGAITVLRLLAAKGKRLRVLMVSDSEYLVKGMREWVPG